MNYGKLAIWREPDRASLRVPTDPGGSQSPDTAVAAPADSQAGKARGASGAPRLSLELAFAAGLLTFLGALILGGHVLHGGLYTDDWPISLIYVQSGTSGLIHQLILGDHSRPLAAIYLALAESVTKTGGHRQAAIGLGLHVLACWSLYWLLRVLSLDRWAAGAIAVLVLLFPFADSSWLWFAVTQSSLSLVFGVLALVAIVYGVRAQGRRSFGLHALAIALMAASVLAYETTAAVVVLAAIAIELTYAERRAAVIRSLMIAAAVALAIVIPRIPGVLPGTDPHQGISLSQQIRHAGRMADQAFTVLTGSAIPFGAAHRNIVVPVLAVILMIAVIAWRRAPAGSYDKRELRRWLLCVLTGAVVIAAAYVVFVDTGLGYEPVATGSSNRINVVAAVGYCLVVYGVAMLGALVLTSGTKLSPRLAPIIAAAAALVVAVGYGAWSRRDVRTWDRAASIQRHELSSLSTSLGKPRAGTTMFVFGGTGEVAPNVYAFGVAWDLDTAVELRWHDPTIHAYTIFSGTTFVCAQNTVTPTGFWNGAAPPPPTVKYGEAVFFDLRDRRHVVITNQGTCARAVREFQPGPLI